MGAINALSSIPDALRNPLIKEYNNILQNYMERRWLPSELSGGKFCEIVYSIIDGMSRNSYPATPSKPRSMLNACKALENCTGLPRSLRILIPRILPSLYEIRNNRGVGHIGGDVDPNYMDSNIVVSMCGWIMAELIRVTHSVSIEEAQNLVDTLVEFRTPIIWEGKGVKRILDPNMAIKDQVLTLTASHIGELSVETLKCWLDYSNKQYLNKLLFQLHKRRYIEFDSKNNNVIILPPDSRYVSNLMKTIAL